MCEDLEDDFGWVLDHTDTDQIFDDLEEVLGERGEWLLVGPILVDSMPAREPKFASCIG